MTKLRNLAFPFAATALLVGGASLWAQQSRGGRPELTHRRPAATPRQDPQRPASTARRTFAHVIEPPDLLLVEVLEALPGRPISGERLVRPDGTISLGFYGDVEVAGLTIPEAKEKIVQHLRKYIADETLGLVRFDPEAGEPVTRDEAKPQSPFTDPRPVAPETSKRRDDNVAKPIHIDPKDTDRVFVEVTAYNSRKSYVEGEVTSPGSFPFTGSDRVLDMIHYAGGLLPWADRGKIRLIRSFPKGSPVQVLPIDYEEITMGTDPSTNYEIKPGDRIVVPRDPTISRPLPAAPQATSPDPGPEARRDQRQPHFDRKPDTDTIPARENPRSLERRLDEMEKKLDAILSSWAIGGISPCRVRTRGPAGSHLPAAHRVPSRERRSRPEVFLDPEQAVVLGQPLGAGDRADLDLAGGGGHGEVGDGGVLGLARAGRDDRAGSRAGGPGAARRASRRACRPGSP